MKLPHAWIIKLIDQSKLYQDQSSPDWNKLRGSSNEILFSFGEKVDRYDIQHLYTYIKSNV